MVTYLLTFRNCSTYSTLAWNYVLYEGIFKAVKLGFQNIILPILEFN